MFEWVYIEQAQGTSSGWSLDPKKLKYTAVEKLSAKFTLDLNHDGVFQSSDTRAAATFGFETARLFGSDTPVKSKSIPEHFPRLGGFRLHLDFPKNDIIAAASETRGGLTCIKMFLVDSILDELHYLALYHPIVISLVVTDKGHEDTGPEEIIDGDKLESAELSAQILQNLGRTFWLGKFEVNLRPSTPTADQNTAPSQ
ncbi:hypothetical protein LTR53_002519 [Teratosphaeriaceae sp. CCFEE 6253]|nr:hypothetical protein LTR53_002519 [Teratosphaeriaceae sp. CCFEE 6253]